MKIPAEIALDREGQYCIYCAEQAVSRKEKDGRSYYLCAACGRLAERSIVIDNAIHWWVDADGNYWHESVGIVVVYEQKILSVLRSIFPFAYAIPAGHLDKGEKPEEAAKRELFEETGIREVDIEKIADFDLPGDSCRRGSDHHRWHLFRARLSKPLVPTLNDESVSFEWFAMTELLQRDDLTYPFKFIIENFPAI